MIKELKEESKKNKILNSVLPKKMGIYDILNESIIFHIDLDELKKRNDKRNKVYNLELNGLIDNNDINSEEIVKYNINKPVYYMIYGMDFGESAINIHSKGNVIIIFSNCTFRREIKITDGNIIMFSHNKYKNLYSYNHLFSETYIRTEGKTNKVAFRNDKFVNQSKNSNVDFGLDLNAEEVLIENTNIECKEFGQLNINTSNLKIINSDIVADEAYICCDDYDITSSTFNIKNGFMLKDSENIDLEQFNNVKQFVKTKSKITR